MQTRYITLLLCMMMLSCNDDFLQKSPKDSLADDNYFTSENDIQLYLNQFYSQYIKGHETGFGSNAYPRNTSGFHLHRGDTWTDNMMGSGSDTDSRYNGNYVVPTSANNTGWDFKNVYQVNWFLQRFRQTPVPEEVLNRYEGEARFFKAWEYFDKVLYFGDVQWLTTDLTVDSPELYEGRTPRAEVMDSVLYCLNFAIQHLPEVAEGAPASRINRDHAYALKSRICLFEGTFRKYHTELGLQSTAGKFLEEAVTASRYLMDSGRYSLYNDGTSQTYWNLFRIKGLNAPNEAIIARVYDGINVKSYAQRYINANGTHKLCATRNLVDEYLCIDGRPIYTDGVEGNFMPNPLFQGYDKWAEMENRDPRLKQTICKPGEYVTIYNQTDNTMDKEKNGTSYPNLAYNGAEPSGYRIIKHWMADNSVLDGNSDQIGIEFRYAEILLNYVEALYELKPAEVTDLVLDETINTLRLRAGFDFATYPNARITIANIPTDPRLDAIYSEKLDYTVTPLLREIRRERRIELAIEDLRYKDLMRWKAGKLLTVPLRGMKFTSVEDLYDGSHTTYPEIANSYQKGKDVYVDKDGFIILYPLSNNFTNGTLPWEDYRYYWPIPKGQLVLNPALKQNPGWENR